MSRRWLLGGYLLLMISLVAGSEPRLVGDGGEYLQMAQSFGSWQWPHADITHFWFYSALASPLVNVAELAGLHPLVGFTGLNFILLGTAFLVVCKRLEWALSFLLFTGPVVWWVDKAHTEVFSFSLLAIAFALMTEAPWWAMICAGAASTQNPPIAALIPLVAALSFTRQPALRRDWRLWTGGALAICLALLHPIYYQARLGRLSPLIDFTRRFVPNRDEFVAAVWDPNIGLLWSFPGLVLVAGIGLIGAPVCGTGTDSVVRDPGVWRLWTDLLVQLLPEEPKQRRHPSHEPVCNLANPAHDSVAPLGVGRQLPAGSPVAPGCGDNLLHLDFL